MTDFYNDDWDSVLNQAIQDSSEDNNLKNTPIHTGSNSENINNTPVKEPEELKNYQTNWENDVNNIKNTTTPPKKEENPWAVPVSNTEPDLEKEFEIRENNFNKNNTINETNENEDLNDQINKLVNNLPDSPDETTITPVKEEDNSNNVSSQDPIIEVAPNTNNTNINDDNSITNLKHIKHLINILNVIRQLSENDRNIAYQFLSLGEEYSNDESVYIQKVLTADPEIVKSIKVIKTVEKEDPIDRVFSILDLETPTLEKLKNILSVFIEEDIKTSNDKKENAKIVLHAIDKIDGDAARCLDALEKLLLLSAEDIDNAEENNMNKTMEEENNITQPNNINEEINNDPIDNNIPKNIENNYKIV